MFAFDNYNFVFYYLSQIMFASDAQKINWSYYNNPFTEMSSSLTTFVGTYKASLEMLGCMTMIKHIDALNKF